MDRKELTADILAKEWNMFQRVRNIGGRADCQDDAKTFCLMRTAQFEAWSEELLAAYQRDLIAAEESGHNLLSEKYGYMMKWTHPEEFEQIRHLLPEISPEKEKIIDEITEIEVRQTKQFRDMYPNLGKRGRPLTAEGNSCATSVETYTRGELMTYSLDTLQRYLMYVRKMDRNKVLLPMTVMKATVKASGYLSLNDAERAYQ